MHSKIVLKEILHTINFKTVYRMSKLPFEKGEGRSSPFQKKPQSNQFFKKPEIKNTTPQYKQFVHQPIKDNKQSLRQTPVRENLKEKISNQPYKSQSSPIEKQLPRQQIQIQPKHEPAPLNYQPLKISKIQQLIIPKQQQQQVNEVVMSNIGLNRYLTRIYITSGLSLMLTLTAAYACVTIPYLANYSEFLMIGGSVVSFISFQKAQSIRPTFLMEKLQEDTIYRTKNSTERLGIYAIGCIGMGISASPIFLAIHETSQIVLPMTMGVTAAIFGGASLVGLMLPRSTVLGYGSVLGGSMLGLVGLNASGILAAKYLGFTMFATTLTTTESYMGIGIFSLMVIYDTHVAIKRYQKGDADHLGMSIQILLDVWNLVIRIATQIAKAKAKEKENQNKK